MVASIMAYRAAYGDKGDLSMLSEKVQNVCLPEDGVEGVVVKGMSEAWIEQARCFIVGSGGCHDRHGHQYS
jgi:hypothetical protein